MTISFPVSGPFALIRFQAEDRVLFLTGVVTPLDRLAQIPRRSGAGGKEGCFDTLSILPFRQVEELGYLARHADEKILCLEIEHQSYLALDEVLAQLPQERLDAEGEGAFVPDDDGFAAMTRRIIEEDIGNGAGCNFVVPRTYHGRIKAFDQTKALGVFRRLLENEYGTYWTFLYFTGERYFIGATPERHLSCRGRQVKMNPISGTFRKMEYGETDAQPALQAFLSDPKETFELLMVVDEELKMMAEICSAGGQVVGPMIKEMSKLLHTEYVLVGESDRDVVDMLRESMFAATVVGSPIENACRVNYRHNETSRGYYGSALALLGRDETGRDILDSPITIRMVDLSVDGRFTISAGATIVRDSDPVAETRETAAKARGMLAALGIVPVKSDPLYRLGERVYGEDMMIKLSARNARLSRFWIEDQSDARRPDPALAGKTALLIDNEDHFIRMLAHMLRSFGMAPRIVESEAFDPARDRADLVVLGPGPGDPRDPDDPRMALGREVCANALAQRQPLLCVCLGHQILCHCLGFQLGKKARPFQGAQELIDLFGAPERVGFYNTFTGKTDGRPRELEISSDPETGEIHALRGATFAGLQFHPESILTTNGLRILYDTVRRIL